MKSKSAAKEKSNNTERAIGCDQKIADCGSSNTANILESQAMQPEKLMKVKLSTKRKELVVTKRIKIFQRK